MRSMRNFLSHCSMLLFSLLFSASALLPLNAFGNADCENQFVKIALPIESRFKFSHARVDGRAVFFEHLPAKRGKPTLFVLNGLFVPSFVLQGFREAFEKNSKGEGLLIMYYSTQIESLYLRALQDKDSALNLKDQASDPLTLSDLAAEAKAVLEASRVRGSIYPVGYSFGAGPAVEFVAHAVANDPAVRRQIKELVLLSPYVHAKQDVFAGANGFEALIRMNPFLGESALQKMRDQSIRSIAVRAVDSLGNNGLPTEVPREAAISGVIAQLQSIVEFDLRAISSIDVPVRFVIPENESSGGLAASREAFEALKGKSSKPVVLATVQDASHHLLRDETELGVNAMLSIMRPEPWTREVRGGN